MLVCSSRNAVKRTSRAIANTVDALDFAVVRCPHKQQRHAASATHPILNTQNHQRPYAHQPHIFQRSSNPTTARYNLGLQRVIDDGKPANAFYLAKRMKEEQVKPDRSTYNHLLRACAQEGLHSEAQAVFDDMIAMGVQPDRLSFDYLLEALPSDAHSQIQAVLDTMREWSIRPNELTYEIIILRLTANQRLELALQYLAKLTSSGISPRLKTASALITCAANLGYPCLALDLARAFDRTSVRRLESHVWVDILNSSAESLYVEGTVEAWQKVVQENKEQPDEGCCLKVLHTAARHGLSGLALEVLEALQSLQIVWYEHHVAPILEAMCYHHEIKEAFMMLAFMRKQDIAMTLDSGRPILDLIKKDTDSLDDAWGKLEVLHEEGHTVDVVALNVVIQAAVALKDLQRAIGTYKAASQLGVKPDIDTYNLLLLGCIHANHRELGDRLLKELKEQGLRPDIMTYQHMVRLCLTQSTYEDAFFYLEEMKSNNMVPPLMVYDSIIRKLVVVGDTRSNLALEELKECGYEVPFRLQSFISSGGAHNGGRPTQTPSDAAVIL